MLINSIVFKSQHAMYKNIKSLFANLILFLLIIALTNVVFRDYFNFAKIETISSFQNKSLHHFKIKKQCFKYHFFESYLLINSRKKYLMFNHSIIVQFNWIIVQNTLKISIYITLKSKFSSKQMIKIIKIKIFFNKTCWFWQK